MKCPNCGSEMEKCVGQTSSGYWVKGECFEYWRCRKCGYDNRSKDEVW